MLQSKYRPKSLESFIGDAKCNNIKLIERSIKEQDLDGHLLLHGITGSGRNLRVELLLKALYGNDLKTKIIEQSFEYKKNFYSAVVEKSEFHICFQAGQKDDFEIIYGIIHFFNINSFVAQVVPYKCLVIKEAQNLSFLTQSKLRSVFEKCIGWCRIILITTQLASITKPLQSRCLIIRVPALTSQDLVTYFESIQAQEQCLWNNETKIQDIVNQGKRNFDLIWKLFECKSTVTFTHNQILTPLCCSLFSNDIQVNFFLHHRIRLSKLLSIMPLNVILKYALWIITSILVIENDNFEQTYSLLTLKSKIVQVASSLEYSFQKDGNNELLFLENFFVTVCTILFQFKTKYSNIQITNFRIRN